MNSIWGSVEQYNTLVWHWPIAIYLLLAGLSAGAALSSIGIKWYGKEHSEGFCGLIKVGAIISPVAISIGSLLLVFDLTKPLSFWKLIIYHNYTSVMSVGALALFAYTPLAFLYAMNVLRCKGTCPIIASWTERLLFVLSVVVGIYTGFLLSAMYAYPLLNSPILPALFLVSGISSGLAATILFGLIFYKNEIKKENAQYLMSIDTKLIPAEILFLFLLFVGLFYRGGENVTITVNALTQGGYATLFWIGVVCMGIVIPLLISYTALKHHAYRVNYIILNSFTILVGVISLRLYIVYAGQVFVG